MADAVPESGATGDVVFLSFEDVCAIHDRALELYGEGQPGVLDEHAIRSAAGQAEAAAFGEYLHEFPSGMAAAYLYFLTHQQGFVNGNKRTAVGSAIRFLFLNGYDFNATSLEVYRITIDLAGEDVRRDRKVVLRELSEWIADRLSPLT